MKNVAVLTEYAAFALPTPGEFAVQGKKNANARAGGGVNYAKNPKPHSSCRTNSS